MTLSDTDRRRSNWVGNHAEGLLFLCMDEACRDQIHETLRPWLGDHPILKRKD